MFPGRGQRFIVNRVQIIEEGMVEIVDRKTLEKIDVKLEEVVSKVSELIK